MEENKQPNPEEIQKDVPLLEHKPQPKKSYSTTGKKLDLLSDNIKKEMNNLILQGCGEVMLKKITEERFGNKTYLLPASIETYRAYINKVKPTLLEEQKIQKELTEASSTELADMKDVISAIEKDDLDNIKQTLQKLYERCAARIKWIEIQQSRPGMFPSSQMESVLGAYFREQRNILEKLVSLKVELQKDSKKQLYEELENLTYMWLVTVRNCYKKLHGEEKLSEFSRLLQEDLPLIIDSVKQK